MHTRNDVDLFVYAGRARNVALASLRHRTSDQSPSLHDVSYAPGGSIDRKNDAEATLARSKSDTEKRKIMY